IPALVVTWPQRKGRFRSAERTEVHLIRTILLYELTFCPFMRTLGVRKEVRHARKTSPVSSESRSSQVSSQGPTQGSCGTISRSRSAHQGISPALPSRY